MFSQWTGLWGSYKTWKWKRELNVHWFRATVYIAIGSICRGEGYYQNVYVHNIIPDKLTCLGWEGPRVGRGGEIKIFLWSKIIESLSLTKAKICKLFHFLNIVMFYKEKL